MKANIKNIFNLSFKRSNLFMFSERIGKIKFIGRRTKHEEAKSCISNNDNTITTKIEKTEIKGNSVSTNNGKNKQAELRLKVNNKLFNDFVNNFKKNSSDTDLHNIKFSEIDSEQVNMGANLDLSDWNSIKLKL